MEPFIADFINNPKAPKWARYLLVTVLCAAIFFLGIMCAVKSPMTVGKIFGIALCALTLAAAVCLLIKIHRSSPAASDEQNKENHQNK